MKSYRRVAVVGDIHGDAQSLNDLLNLFSPDEDRHFVFVGDYVNRGPNSRQTIDTLLEFADRSSTTFLMGNHDYELIKFLEGGDFGHFARLGGLWTIRSYISDEISPDVVGQFRDSFPDGHQDWLASLDLFWEDSSLRIHVSHCGLDPQDPSNRSLETLVLTPHPDLFHLDGPVVDFVVVAGHYLQRNGEPYLSDHFVCLDTGAGSLPNGKLTALLMPERRIISVPEGVSVAY